ncbi:hypothetical protein EV421DRAFT_1838940 [Armillaria borealis]|uniref:Ubiquinol-cytochrome C reductase hinge domain-containing protein n=1 Tax=Armillaria borealis TaxID=47425 RepID=A0AA39MIA2_9AGAR|nr:hypothetical protein EV421DRAFT_1838940 [Armillaria borealis]
MGRSNPGASLLATTRRCLHPVICDECKESFKCAALVKHFEHCQQKVSNGKGFNGEACVEELMHCVDEYAAPKLFAKLP